MAKINTTNYQPVTAWNGTQDLLIVEQPDGTKVATPEQVKQYVEAGDFEATGEIIDGHGNILKDMAKSADVDTEIGNLSQTGLAGDIATQLKKLNDFKCEGGKTAANAMAITDQMDAIKASGRSGVFPFYCSSGNADYRTIGYCMCIGIINTPGVSVIIGINSYTGEIWTNGNTSQNAGDWRGWRKIN